MAMGHPADYIQQAQIIKGLASGVTDKALAKQLGFSTATIAKYRKEFAKEIEENRLKLREKILEIGDEVIAKRYIEVADLAVGILQKTLKKYQDENRDLKPNELSYISIIGATAIDKQRVIENKPTSLNHAPVVFNFSVYQKPKEIEAVKMAEGVIEAQVVPEKRIHSIFDDKPMLHTHKPTEEGLKNLTSHPEGPVPSHYKTTGNKPLVRLVTKIRQPDGSLKRI